jgi:hypothetical protein
MSQIFPKHPYDTDEEQEQLDKSFVHNHAAVYKPLYSDWCLPSKEWQRAKLEALRYRFGNYKHHYLQSLRLFIKKYL